MTEISFKCWTPAVPFKKPDNIVSSEFSTLKVFTPSYEKQPYICMDQLMANEYQRIWFMERDEWARKTFASKNGKTYVRRSSRISQKDLVPHFTSKGKDDGKANAKKVESRKKPNSDKQPRKK